MLEGVDRGDPGQDQHDALEQLAIGALSLGGVVKGIQVLGAEELHGHRGHLAELERALAIGGQRLAAAGQGVKRVPPLVQQGPHVAVETHGVHEDEGQAIVFECGLIAAGSLALAVGQVEQALRAEEGELGAKLGVDLAKDGLGSKGQLRDVVKGLQGRPARGIDGGVPGPEGRDAEPGAMLFLDLARQGDDDVLDGAMEAKRVVDPVVETLALAKGEIDEAVKTRGLRDLDPQSRASGRTGRPARLDLRGAGWPRAPRRSGEPRDRSLPGTGPSAPESSPCPRR